MSFLFFPGFPFFCDDVKSIIKPRTIDTFRIGGWFSVLLYAVLLAK